MGLIKNLLRKHEDHSGKFLGNAPEVDQVKTFLESGGYLSYMPWDNGYDSPNSSTKEIDYYVKDWDVKDLVKELSTSLKKYITSDKPYSETITDEEGTHVNKGREVILKKGPRTVTVTIFPDKTHPSGYHSANVLLERK